jgi:hypothetical protein
VNRSLSIIKKEAQMPFFGRLIRSFNQHLKQKAREENPPRYIIEEPGDMLHVPPEKLDLFLSELKVGISTIHDMVTKGLLTGESARVSIQRFTWIDDGETNGKINVKGA